MEAESYYEILGIRPDADDEAVKQAYRERAKDYHPDRNPGDAEAERRFKLVGTAYEALKDASRRQTYDEWLAFNMGRQKSGRRQWGRLAALLAILLVGPSVVLYGVVASGGISFRSSSPEKASTPPPAPVVHAEAPPQPAKPIVTPEEPAKPAADEQPAPAEGRAATQTAGPPIEKAESATKPEILIIERGASDPPANETSAEAQKPERTVKHPETTASVPVETPDSAADKRTAAGKADQPADPTTTQAIPEPSPDRDQDQGGVSASPSQDKTALAEESQPGQKLDGFAVSEGGAMASARLLAELKEPGKDGASGQSAKAPAAPPAGADQRMASRSTEAPSGETFTDCEFCPVMSLTRRRSAARVENNLAVSAAEITVGEWNVCVRDGACPPYRASDASAKATVIGLSERNAAAYAEWLSDLTGQTYRIVTPLSSERKEPFSARFRTCDDDGNRRSLSGWDWLDDKPRRDCPSIETSQDSGGHGFRVARQVRHDG